MMTPLPLRIIQDPPACSAASSDILPQSPPDPELLCSRCLDRGGSRDVVAGSGG